MTRWVQCRDGGYVNLAFVAEIRRLPHGKGEKLRYGLYDSQSRMIGEAWRKFDPDVDVGELVPAAAGSYVIEVNGDKSGVWYSLMPVIAWRIPTFGEPIPILADEAADSSVILIPAPDGKFIRQYVATYDSLDAAIKDITEEIGKRDG